MINLRNITIIAQVIVSLLFVPFTLWMHRKLHPKNINRKWMNAVLRGTGSQISEALDFIHEIEAFEKR